MKKIITHTLAASTIFLLFVPVFSLAAPDTNKDYGDGGTGFTFECATANGKDALGNDIQLYGNCTWSDLIQAINKIVGYAIMFALSFSVVVLAWNGFEIMMAGDNAGKRSSARKRMGNWAIGVAWMLGAWLVITLITNALLTDAVKKLLPW
jgi:hypothetical protein